MRGRGEKKFLTYDTETEEECVGGVSQPGGGTVQLSNGDEEVGQGYEFGEVGVGSVPSFAGIAVSGRGGKVGKRGLVREEKGVGD